MRVLREGPLKITRATVDATWRRRARDQRIIIGDAECRGLALVVNSTGMSWRFDYKPRGTDPTTGKRFASQSVVIGNPHSHSVERARTEASALKGRAQSGGDPGAARRERLAAERAAHAAARAAALTVSALIDLYEGKHIATLRPATRRDVLSRLRQHLAPIKDRPAHTIGRRDAAMVVDQAAKAGETTARRVRDYARAMWGWGSRRGTLPEDAANPWEKTPAPGRDIPRDRVLTDEEIGLVWNAAGTLASPYGPMIRFLTLTLARREEATAAAWGEIAPDLSSWTQPASRTKNAKAHVVHLSEPVRAILRALLTGEDGQSLPRPVAGALIFGTAADKPITTHSWVKRQIDKAVAQARAKADRPPVPHWVLHDLRRTGPTWLAGAGFPPHVADRLLNHVEGTIRGVARVYQKTEFIEERRRALDAWAAHVLACAEGGMLPDNILDFRGARLERAR